MFVLHYSHGNKEVFSCMGIKLAVDWFRHRGHSEIRVLVPQWRKEASRIDSPIKGKLQTLSDTLSKQKQDVSLFNKVSSIRLLVIALLYSLNPPPTPTLDCLHFTIEKHKVHVSERQYRAI